MSQKVATVSACPFGKGPTAHLASLFVNANEAGWSLNQIARSSGRSVAHVHQSVHAGLLPEYLLEAMASARRAGAALSDELYEALTAVFAAGAVTPRLASLMRDDPEAVVAAAEGLVLLALLSGSPTPKERKSASGAAA